MPPPDLRGEARYLAAQIERSTAQRRPVAIQGNARTVERLRVHPGVTMRTTYGWSVVGAGWMIEVYRRGTDAHARSVELGDATAPRKRGTAAKRKAGSGGARTGAGRPSTGEALRAVSVRLTPGELARIGALSELLGETQVGVIRRGIAALERETAAT